MALQGKLFLPDHSVTKMGVFLMYIGISTSKHIQLGTAEHYAG